jgi:hypothetical protein
MTNKKIHNQEFQNCDSYSSIGQSCFLKNKILDYKIE